jgi:hypothetical protein
MESVESQVWNLFAGSLIELLLSFFMLLPVGLSYVVTNRESTYIFVVQSPMHEMGRRNLRHAGKSLLLLNSCD